jgi:hypothetical protein
LKLAKLNEKDIEKKIKIERLLYISKLYEDYNSKKNIKK